LQTYAHSPQLQQQLSYWLNQPYHLWQGLPLDAPLTLDGNRAVRVANMAELSFTLERKQTEALLQQVPAAYHIQINDVLLAALLLAYRRWSGQESLLLTLEGHGREELFEQLELSRTVGWFTSVYPLLLHVSESEGKDLGTLLKAVKEQLRAIPERGVGYCILRYLGEEKVQQQLAELPQAQLNFNYLGQTDALMEQTETIFKIAQESPGLMQHGLHNNLPHLLTVTSIIFDGQLHVGWNYSTRVHRRESVEAFMYQYQQALEELIGHCLSQFA
jgi:non-ribosomal peptide synthase protein (TIGR01720 family)